MTTTSPITTNIDSLSHDGRGVAHLNGKTIFISGALPGETVQFRYLRKHNKYDEGTITAIITASPDRIVPPCQYADICGGCDLQHMNHAKQISFKINVLQEMLNFFGELATKEMLPPIIGPIFQYRKRARLSVKYLAKKQRILIGFHEKNGRYVADIDCCKVLDPRVGEKINALRELIGQLSIYQHIPQIEVALSDKNAALIFRILNPCSAKDLALLQTFAATHNLQIYLQSGGIDTIKPLTETEPKQLSYTLPQQNVELFFAPSDFTQINQDVNQMLVQRVLEQLAPQTTDTILDLFCGLGNFTIPLAQKCGQITGIEGSNTMVTRAQQNALHNSCNNTQFFAYDLTKELPAITWATNKYTKILLDPPRTGALEICQIIAKFAAAKIVYVSCNPATLARDAKEIVNQGYILEKVGIIDMFPQTHHMESLAVFTKKSPH